MDDDDEYHHMDQILPGLWIGDLHSATDGKTLTANNIRSILTMMRGRFSIPEVPMLRVTLTYTIHRAASTVDLRPTPDPFGRHGGR